MGRKGNDALRGSANRVVELFAGVGGFHLGLAEAGWEVIWANQWEPSTKRQHAADCYRAHFPDTPMVSEDINLVLDQVRKQLDKIVTVVRVVDISSENFVERDLMLIKVSVAAAQRVEISLLVEMFRGRVVDVQHDNLMIEISGTEGKIEAFIDLMRPYGIVELARTGRIALVRGALAGGLDR